ncbi:hypothetical protein ACWCPS_36195 [Streptomyces mauvecolor]
MSNTGDDLDHLKTWWDEPNFYLGRRLDTGDLIGLLDSAAQTAGTLTELPAPRPPLAA